MCCFDPSTPGNARPWRIYRGAAAPAHFQKRGMCLYAPSAESIKAYCMAQVDNLWKRSPGLRILTIITWTCPQKLWDEKNRLLSQQSY